MATGPAGTYFDTHPIQSVTLVDSQGNFTSVATASGVSSTTIGNIQGVTAASVNGTLTNPILIGGLDTNSPQLLQPAQINQNGDLSVDLGGQLNLYNDSLNSIISDGFPGQTRQNWGSGLTIAVPLAPAQDINNNTIFQLGTAGMPNIAPVRAAEFILSNGGLTQPITGFSVAFAMTVDSVNITRTFTYPLTGSQGSGTQKTYWMPFPKHNGIFNKATMNVVIGSTGGVTTAAYVQVQTKWIFSDTQSYPPEWQWTFNQNLTTPTVSTVLAAPVAGSRIAVEELVVTNASASVATIVSFLPHGGSNFYTNFAGSNGLGYKYGPYSSADAYRGIGTGLALDAVGASINNMWISGKGHYEPI